MKLVAIFFILSFSIQAETIIKGEEAKELFENLHAYEYSSGAISRGIEYRLTVRHDDKISCEKEETIYSNDVQIEYTCTQK